MGYEPSYHFYKHEGVGILTAEVGAYKYTPEGTMEDWVKEAKRVLEEKRDLHSVKLFMESQDKETGQCSTQFIGEFIRGTTHEASDYKIEVGVTPHPHDNKHKPFYWVLFGYYNEWCNEGAGWAASPEEAWQEAKAFFNFFYRDKNKGGK